MDGVASERTQEGFADAELLAGMRAGNSPRPRAERDLVVERLPHGRFGALLQVWWRERCEQR